MADEIKKTGQIPQPSGNMPVQPSASMRMPVQPGAPEVKRVKGVDKLFIDEHGDSVSNYTGDAESERDYRPVRQSHEYKSGCLGGLMYFVFICCLSIVLACVAWMAASDALALNAESFETTVVLPADIFTTETVDDVDEDGNVIGTKTVTHADIDYVTDRLKEAGLVEYKWLFEFFCRISHADTKFDPGEYTLKSSFDYRALVQNMRKGSGAAATVKVTIPEGFTMRQIFARLEEYGVCSQEELMEAAADATYNYSFLDADAAGDASRLEGYLFPDTYEFYVGMNASSAINKFLQTFNNRLTDEMLSTAEARGMSFYDIIKIASLIEKEAANDAERTVIASVIYNRLYSGMTLGIDASILYIYPDHEGAPTEEMLSVDSPYNTRIYKGLTPTPISNPGLASINAALYPDETAYYYYALDVASGTHRFFTNANEFNAFVATQNYG